LGQLVVKTGLTTPGNLRGCQAVTRDENIIDRFERIVRPRAGRLEGEGDPR